MIEYIEYILYGSAVLHIFSLIFMVYCRDLIKLRLKLFLLRKRGVKKVIIFGEDKTCWTEARVPDTDNAIKIGDNTILIDRDNIFWDRNEGKPCLVVSTAEQATIDPVGDKKRKFDPRLLKMIIYNAMLIGAKLAQRKEKMIMILLFITAACAGAAAILSFLNYNETTMLRGMIEVIIQNTAILLRPTPVP